METSSKINFYTTDELWSEVAKFKEKNALKNNNQALEELIRIAVVENTRKSGQLPYLTASSGVEIPEKTKDQILHFYENVSTTEKKNNLPLLLYLDKRINAIFTSCSIRAKNLIEFIDTDAVIDPINQEIYRENRELKPKDPSFQVMKEDAKLGRPFNDIVIEYVPSIHQNKYRPEIPLKVLGGQHRCEAIKTGVTNGQSDIIHTIRVYFNLNLDQRADVANISNTNIQVSPDLRDRIEEHKSGEGKLRNWCHEIGLLPKDKDFEDKKKTDSGFPTVRMARSLIVNFYRGRNYTGDISADLIYPVICETGGSDEEYDGIKKKADSFVKDDALVQFGKAFVKLHEKQILKITEITARAEKIPLSTRREFRNKALSLAVLSSYAFVAGLLQKHPDRLKKLYNLTDYAEGDPLNAFAMSETRHEDFDSETYRGLGARTEDKELGRLTQLFLLYSEVKEKTINEDLIIAAVEQYHAKYAGARAKKSREKVK